MNDHSDEHTWMREGELLAYLEGDAAPALVEHVAGCSDCRAALAELRDTQLWMAAAALRLDCPAPERLLLYSAELLELPERAPLAAHLATCADCQADLALITTPPAPAPLDRLARAAGRLIRAVLQPAAAPALALRGHELRRVAYAAGPYQVLLAITPPAAPGGSAQLEGQILGAETDLSADVGQARLLQNTALTQSGPLDDLGFFAFDAVTAGTYTIELTLGDAQIQIEAVAVE